jgi:hypothetical protein
MEPVRELPRTQRLRLHRLECVWDTAGEPVPGSVARSLGQDVAGSGSLADHIRGEALR